MLEFISKEEHGIAHNLHKPFLVPWTTVMSALLAVVEVLEGWKPTDVMLLTDRVELGAVECCKYRLLVLFEVLGRLLVFRFGCLAVSTPRCVEHHKNVPLLLEEWLEVFTTEMVNLW